MNINMLLGALIALTGFLPLNCTETVNQIQEIRSFTEARLALNQANQDTLVAFDIDDTITTPASKINWAKYHPAQKNLTKQAQAKIALKPNKKPDRFYTDLWRSADGSPLIEPLVSNLITALQNHGVPTIALTALYAGPSYFEPYLPEWRLHSLRALGIDFNRIDFPDMVFHNLPTDQFGNPTAFYHGLLCSSNIPKGQVLKAFLDRLKWRPAQVIFFDDLLENINSVAQVMREMKIPFYGFHYLGAQDLPGKLNPDIAKIQIKTLFENEKWLSEPEAQTALAPA